MEQASEGRSSGERAPKGRGSMNGGPMSAWVSQRLRGRVEGLHLMERLSASQIVVVALELLTELPRPAVQIVVKAMNGRSVALRRALIASVTQAILGCGAVAIAEEASGIEQAQARLRQDLLGSPPAPVEAELSGRRPSRLGARKVAAKAPAVPRVSVRGASSRAKAAGPARRTVVSGKLGRGAASSPKKLRKVGARAAGKGVSKGGAKAASKTRGRASSNASSKVTAKSSSRPPSKAAAKGSGRGGQRPGR